MTCVNCRKDIAVGSRFCYNCGAKQPDTPAPGLSPETGGKKKLMRSSTDKKIAGVLEVFGAILLVLGLFTRAAALLLAIEMGVAIWKVHSTGSYLAVHNYEFPLAVLAGSFALATVGAGLLSLDHPLLERGGKSRFPRNSKLAR